MSFMSFNNNSCQEWFMSCLLAVMRGLCHSVVRELPGGVHVILLLVVRSGSCLVF